MCGFAGLVRRDGPVAEDPSTIAAMLGAALAHRGPDGAAYWVSSNRDVLLVHRRLAIIDPGPDGAQPMAIADRRHLIVFNGEIYNYRELRSELEAAGECFETRSDTEVLLRLLVSGGPAALARLRGMFAVAWWDAREHSLLLARDRFGIKPLYVAAAPERIAFASELGALRRARFINGQPSAAGVLAFLSWGSIPPPLTWQQDVEMLAPGTWRIWRQDGRDTRGGFANTADMYWSGRRHPLADGVFREAVGSAVRDSVRAHLVADVPVGVFLSGGIDSAAIISAASSIGADRLQTFTVGFDDRSSEADRARQVAAAFRTNHHELHVDASQIAVDLPRILGHLDQPTIDGVNAFYVAQAVAGAGIKTVLSGTGGDELFGGYPSFTRLPLAVAAKRGLAPAWPIVARLANVVVPKRFGSRWRHFAKSTSDHLAAAYRVQRGFLMPDEVADLAGPRLREDAVWCEAHDALEVAERGLIGPAADEQPEAGVARLESRLYLASQLLRDTDVMAMAHGLEVRLPFVDHILLDVVWPELGFHTSLLHRKRLLYETLDLPLPDAVVAHPKQGFTLPFARWLGDALAPAVHDGMRRLADGGWIRRDAPEEIWRAWREGAVHWTRPWGLAVLGYVVQ